MHPRFPSLAGARAAAIASLPSIPSIPPLASIAAVATIASIALAGCGSDDTQPWGEHLGPPPPLGSPDAVGPYRVGVTTFEAAAGSRTLPIEVWYPADPGEGAAPASYELTLGALSLATMPSPHDAVRDAPTDRRGAPYPVVVFSHGFGGIRFQSVYLTEYLASHGFVVAAPDHVGNTFHAVVDDSRALPTVEIARLRPGDVGVALDALLARSFDSSDPLASIADETRAGVAGHSFGGFTALRVAGAVMDVEALLAHCAAAPDEVFCDGWEDAGTDFPPSARDERFSAALPQAPGGAAAFVPNGLASVAVPTMIQAGTADTTTPFEAEAEAPFAALPSPAWLLAIEGAGHFTFSDMCPLVDSLGIGMEEFEDGCSPANIDYAVAHPVIATHATAFFQVALAGKASLASWLEPAAAPAGVATLTAK